LYRGAFRSTWKKFGLIITEVALYCENPIYNSKKLWSSDRQDRFDDSEETFRKFVSFLSIIIIGEDDG